jgi:dTDP-4-dehydrorhamnose 3,5-epimerase
MIIGDIEGVIVTPQKIIEVVGGDVFHAMKSDDPGYRGFGEAYFSTIEYGFIKAWKRHSVMTLNLVVPVGAVQFVIYDDRLGKTNSEVFQDVILSKENYCRLTVPPMVWLGFQGLDKDTSVVLNMASIRHDPNESERKAVEEIKFDWRL